MKALKKMRKWITYHRDKRHFIRCHHCHGIHVIAYGYVIDCIDCGLLSYWQPAKQSAFVIMVIEVLTWLLIMVVYGMVV
jgi:hypothetical protein